MSEQHPSSIDIIEPPQVEAPVDYNRMTPSIGSVALEGIQRGEENVAPSLNFVYARHTLEDAPAIGQQLKDYDVIALESVESSEEQRQKMQGVYTAIISSKLSEERVDEIYEQGDFHNEFITELLYQLRGTDKRVVLIDVNQDDPDYAVLHQQTLEANKTLSEAIKGNLPNDTLRQLTVASMTANANEVRFREHVVTEQLREVVTSEGMAPNSRIGVFEGAMHTPVQHNLSREFDTQRDFLNVGAGYHRSPQERARFNPEITAMRQLNLKPDAELDTRLVDRIVLTDIYANATGENTESVSTRAIDQMSDNDVSVLLKKIDKAKGARVAPGLRLQKVLASGLTGLAA